MKQKISKLGCKATGEKKGTIKTCVKPSLCNVTVTLTLEICTTITLALLIYYIYLLLTAIGLMPGGSVCHRNKLYQMKRFPRAKPYVQCYIKIRYFMYEYWYTKLK
jgi:hypothetical protein